MSVARRYATRSFSSFHAILYASGQSARPDQPDYGRYPFHPIFRLVGYARRTSVAELRRGVCRVAALWDKVFRAVRLIGLSHRPFSYLVPIVAAWDVYPVATSHGAAPPGFVRAGSVAGRGGSLAGLFVPRYARHSQTRNRSPPTARLLSCDRKLYSPRGHRGPVSPLRG